MSEDLPSEFSMTLALPDSMTAQQEFVVPRSIPTMLLYESKKRSETHAILLEPE